MSNPSPFYATFRETDTAKSVLGGEPLSQVKSVFSELDSLETRLARLISAFSNLADRLHPIVRPVEMGQSVEEKLTSQSVLFNRIQSISREITNLEERVHTLHSSIDL